MKPGVSFESLIMKAKLTVQTLSVIDTTVYNFYSSYYKIKLLYKLEKTCFTELGIINEYLTIDFKTSIKLTSVVNNRNVWTTYVGIFP